MTTPEPQDAPHATTATLNPAALTLHEAARLLSAAGGKKVTVEAIQGDIDAGAPTVPTSGGGPRINLVHYAAWLVREVQSQ